MKKIKRVAGFALMLLAMIGLAACEKNEYFLSPEVTIQVPEEGLSVELGGTLEIKADVKNAGENPHYQWYVNDIKVSTSPVLQFNAVEPGNNTVKLTVSNDDGSSSDAVTVLVARAPLEVAISVVGDKSTTLQYQDSVILRGIVYSREDYEIEWIREGERVSKEFYYVFKAEKEGTHRLTFKALDKNGKYVTEDIDLTVEVPQLAAIIKEPKHGFRCPQGQKIMLHGEANRVNNVKFEWIVGGKVVCTEPDYEFEGTALDNVEVALRVIDPTQTATETKTIEVHHPYLYGSLLVTHYDMAFLDYMGNITPSVFTAANPQLSDKEIAFRQDDLAYDDTRIVALTYVIGGYDADHNRIRTLTFQVIDKKLFSIQKTFKIIFSDNVTIRNLVLQGGKLFLTSTKTKSTNDNEPNGVYAIDIDNETKQLVWTGTPTAVIGNGGNIYIFTGSKVLAFKATTGEKIYDVAGQAGYMQGMDDPSTWTLHNGKIFHTTTSSSYENYFDLEAGTKELILTEANFNRLEVANLASDGKQIYSCNDGFLSIIDPEAKTQTYLADLMKIGFLQYCTLPETHKNLFVSPSGQLIVRFRRSFPAVDKIVVIEDDYENPVSTFESNRSDCLYSFIPVR